MRSQPEVNFVKINFSELEYLQLVAEDNSNVSYLEKFVKNKRFSNIFLVRSLMIHFRLDETTETLLISIYSIFMIFGLLLNVSIIISFFSKNVS